MDIEISYTNQSNNEDNAKVEIFSKDRPEDSDTDSAGKNSADASENQSSGEADQN